MDYRHLGDSDLTVSTLGIGTWPMGGTHAKGDYGSVDEAKAVAAIRRAIDAGITLIDTAPTYGSGRAEELVGEAIDGMERSRLQLISKCGVYWDSDAAGWRTDSSPQALRERLQETIRRLGTDYLDVLILHLPDRSRDAAEVAGTLQALVRAGEIRAWGVSNFSSDDLRAYDAQGTVAAQQVGYHMFDRRMERHMFPVCRDLGVGVMAFGSLAHGLLAGQIREDTRFAPGDWRGKGMAFGLPLFTPENLPSNVAVVDRLEALARDLGASLPQMALAWVLRDPVVSTALVGIRTPDEVDDNLGALGLELSKDVLQRIDEILSAAAGTSPDMPEYSAA